MRHLVGYSADYPIGTVERLIMQSSHPSTRGKQRRGVICPILMSFVGRSEEEREEGVLESATFSRRATRID